MDKLSVKVLHHLSNQDKPVHRNSIVEKFGKDANNSLDYLKDNGYIKDGKIVVGFSFSFDSKRANPKYGSDNMYEITSFGKDYLESKPGNDFDRWSTRIIAIWGAVTGTVALVLELVSHFQR